MNQNREERAFTLTMPLFGDTSVGKNNKIRASRGEARISITQKSKDLDIGEKD